MRIYVTIRNNHHVCYGWLCTYVRFISVCNRCYAQYRHGGLVGLIKTKILYSLQNFELKQNDDIMFKYHSNVNLSLF